MDDDLLSIGRFARLSGLSVGALRHYDELGVFLPADIDGVTGYRRYRRGQLETARTVARLRELEVPLEEIRDVLAMDDPAAQRRRIGDHRTRIEARATRLNWTLHVLGRLRDGKEPIVTDTATATRDATTVELDAATHRQLGVDLYNSTWALIEKPDRTPIESDEMIHRAHASRWHWARAAGVRTVNHARGEYLCSRVYATLGRAEPAAWHARRCLEIVESIGEDEGRESWDIAGAYEAMARAAHVAGDAASTALWKGKALEALTLVENVGDREPIAGDLETLPG